MSLYDIVFGDPGRPQRGAALLAVLGSPDVGRFRDALVEKDADGNPVIAIYTRNGGGNREHYDPDTEAGPHCSCTGCIAEHQLPAHPLYLVDVDDGFDSTYATFYFKPPDDEGLLQFLREVAGEHVDTSARWLDAIAAVEKATGKRES